MSNEAEPVILPLDAGVFYMTMSHDGKLYVNNGKHDDLPAMPLRTGSGVDCIIELIIRPKLLDSGKLSCRSNPIATYKYTETGWHNRGTWNHQTENTPHGEAVGLGTVVRTEVMAWIKTRQGHRQVVELMHKHAEADEESKKQDVLSAAARVSFAYKAKEEAWEKSYTIAQHIRELDDMAHAEDEARCQAIADAMKLGPQAPSCWEFNEAQEFADTDGLKDQVTYAWEARP